MRNRGPLFIGSLLVIFGIVLLLGNIFQINIWALCWPTGLILVGVWLLLRPRFALPSTVVNIRFIEDEKRYGVWQVGNEEFWSFICNVRLDLTQANTPSGETTYHMYGFIGDIDILAPKDVGLSISSNAFITSARINGQKGDSFLVPATYTSENYASLERKIHLETYFFITDLDTRQ
jgi:predicted membrane protein